MAAKSVSYFTLLAILIAPSACSSMTIIPQPWQVLINNADLVGIVECTTAGEIVARYRVVESWGKGPRKGSELLIRGPASPYEPTLPLALVGERFLVAAWKWQPTYQLGGLGMRRGPGSSVPEWWREDRPDYVLPALNVSSLGVAGDTRVGESGPRLLGDYQGGLDGLRREARALLALPDEEREASVLRALIEWHIVEPAHRTSPHQVRVIADPTLLGELERKAGSGSVDTVVTALVSYAKRGGPSSSISVLYVLYGGGRRTMECLSRIRETEGDFKVGMLSSAIRSIRRRLGLDPAEDKNLLAVGPKPPEETLEAMRFALGEQAENPNGRGLEARVREEKRAQNWHEAFVTLTTYDPEYLVPFLVNWHNAGNGIWGESEGYGVGSYFCWRDAGDRPAHFRRLLRARDSYVRVAAAVYLSFENETEGLAALRECTRIPGDPGVWAALNLARRGDRTAVVRALEGFRTIARNSAEHMVHRNLQKRLLVLLSNSAARSHVAQPERWSYVEQPDDQIRVYQRLVMWWNQNNAKLTIFDPWFEDLAAKKVE